MESFQFSYKLCSSKNTLLWDGFKYDENLYVRKNTPINDLNFNSTSYHFDILKQQELNCAQLRESIFNKNYRMHPQYEMISLDHVIEMIDMSEKKYNYPTIRKGIHSNNKKNRVTTYLYIVDEKLNIVQVMRPSNIIDKNTIEIEKKHKSMDNDIEYNILDELLSCPPQCPIEIDLDYFHLSIKKTQRT